MNGWPINLRVDDEPDWRVKISGPDGVHWLSIRGRMAWKRVTAISHARWFARHNPGYEVWVHLDDVFD